MATTKIEWTEKTRMGEPHQFAGVAVRPARTEDLETIVALNQLLAQDLDGSALLTGAVRVGVQAQLDDSRLGRYWLACIGQDIVGQVRVWEEWYDWGNAPAWWLDNVVALSRHRRQGILRALFQHVLSLAVVAGVSRIRLHVAGDNHPARQTYAALGFEVIGDAMELEISRSPRGEGDGPGG